MKYVTEFETRKTVQTESRTKPIGLSLAEVQPVFGETKATKQIAHYDTPPFLYRGCRCMLLQAFLKDREGVMRNFAYLWILRRWEQCLVWMMS